MLGTAPCHARYYPYCLTQSIFPAATHITDPRRQVGTEDVYIMQLKSLQPPGHVSSAKSYEDTGDLKVGVGSGSTWRECNIWLRGVCYFMCGSSNNSNTRRQQHPATPTSSIKEQR